MTSLYLGFQARLARLRQTGEIHPSEYGVNHPWKFRLIDVAKVIKAGNLRPLRSLRLTIWPASRQ